MPSTAKRHTLAAVTVDLLWPRRAAISNEVSSSTASAGGPVPGRVQGPTVAQWHTHGARGCRQSGSSQLQAAGRRYFGADTHGKPRMSRHLGSWLRLQAAET